MKILIVEDDRNKRLFLEYFLKEKNIEFYSFSSVRPAISYSIKCSSEIDGIILALGLTSYDYSDDYDFTKGLELIKELTKKRISIPILINSSTYVDLDSLMKMHSNIKAQMDDDEFHLRQFVNSLIKGSGI